MSFSLGLEYPSEASMEASDVRLARLEEAMVSVKGDTSHLRKSFDAFQERYWIHLLAQTGKLASLSAMISLIVGIATVAIAHAVWK